jgi:hypothetical protein
MDGDGRLDVVSVWSDKMALHVMVHRQTAPRVFAAPDQYDDDMLGYYYYDAMAAADLDQDGIPDLAITDDYGSVALLLSGGGPGYHFGSPVLGSPMVEALYGVAIADFDGDGYRDIAVAIDQHDPNVGIYWGLGGGAFAVRQDQKRCDQGTGVAIVDANEDGRPDLALSCYGGGAQILINQGGRSFMPVLLPGASGSGNLATGDLNRDGHVDVVVPDMGLMQLVPSLGDGHGTFTVATGPLTPIASDVVTAAMGDLDGDGNPDVVLWSSANQTSIDFFQGDGYGGFQKSRPFPNAKPTRRLAVADVDGDGVADLLDPDGPTIVYGPCP